MIYAINQRKSIRTYQKKELIEKDVNKIETCISEVMKETGPFGNTIKLYFYKKDYIDDADAQLKIGTYGFVKNPPAFIAGSIKNTFTGIIDYGYLFEKLIIMMTQIDIGTVWLGGTFNRASFNHLIGEDEVVPAITPVGYAEQKTSIKDKMIRSVSKGDQRKDFGALFFDQNPNQPLSTQHPFAKYLELVRIGPSASNKQPWRVIVDNQKAHFYLKRTPNYASNMPFEMQALDLGIAIFHFEAGLIEDQIEYHRCIDHAQKRDDDMVYIITFDLSTTKESE